MVGAGKISGNDFFGHKIERIDAIDKGSAGTKGNKGIHIRSFMDKTFEAAYKEFLVYHHYYSGKNKLNKAYRNAVFRKESRKRPVPHNMAH